MYELENLVSAKVINSNYRLVDLPADKSINFSNLKSMTDSDQANYSGIVVIDNVKWIATIRSVTATIASRVLSCNGELFGMWERNERTFSLLKMVSGKLAVISSYRLPRVEQQINNSQENQEKEKQKMANLQDFNALAPESTDLEGMNSFTEMAMGEDVKEASGAKGPKAPSEKEMAMERANAFIQEASAGTTIADTLQINLFNQKYGRCGGFITRNDATVKVTKKSVVKLDGSGNKILTAEAPESVRKDFEAGKSVARSYFQKEDTIALTHAKPAKPIGVIIGTPVGGDIDITDIVGQSGAVSKKSDDTTLVVRILPYDMALTYLAALYDNKIKESEQVMGDKASMITHVARPVEIKAKDGSGSVVSKYRSTLKQDTKVRKTLLTETNYFPLKLYDTIPYQNLSEDDAVVLNRHFAAMKKSKPEAFNNLAPADKAKIHEGADGVITSDYFKAGASFDVSMFGGSVPRYDIKGAEVSKIAIPKREAKPSKSDPTKMSYPFVFIDLDDEEKGPFSVPEYDKIFKFTGMKKDDFKDAIKGLARSSRGGKGGNGGNKKTNVSSDMYLRAVASGQYTDTTATIKDIQQRLNDISLN